MSEAVINITDILNDIYKPYLKTWKRHEIYYGGAGSGKSVFVTQKLVTANADGDGKNILVVRQVAKANRDSTFALFKRTIRQFNLWNYYKINEGDLRIKCKANNKEIIFAGLDDVEKLKSITFESGDVDIVWVEEASETAREDILQLNLRLRGKGNTILSFNPVSATHWLKTMVDTAKDNTLVLKSTYKDNRFLKDEYKAELEGYKDTDPYYYQVYCLGEWGVIGGTVFNAQIVTERIAKLRGIKPLMRGYFAYEYDVKDCIVNDSIKFINDEQGEISIFKDVVKRYPYVLGGDTAGDGSDCFTAHVIDNVTGEQVAVYHKEKVDEDIYAEQMYCLGIYYNSALIGLEVNFSTHPVKVLQRLQYPRIYVRESSPDSFTGKLADKFGFRTDKVTRPQMLASLVTIVRENVELINDIATLDEMLTFVRNEKGRPEAQNGAHDDLIMGLAITHEIRPQQSFAKTSEAKDKAKWRDEMFNDYYTADDADKALLIKMWGNPF